MTTAPKGPKEEEPASAPAPEAPAAPEKAAKKERQAKAKESKKADEGKGKPAKPAVPGPTAPGGKPIPDNPNFRYIVRLSDTDLDGRRATALALTGVRGVGLRLAEVVCRISHVDPHEMIGNLPEPVVEGVEATVQSLAQKLPPWMLNHPTERVGGAAYHYIGSDLETSGRDDINQMKMIRSYRGVRHERGQKVRGQRTRSNGRTGMAAGVLKKAAKEAAAKAAQAESAASAEKKKV